MRSHYPEIDYQHPANIAIKALLKDSRFYEYVSAQLAFQLGPLTVRERFARFLELGRICGYPRFATRVNLEGDSLFTAHRVVDQACSYGYPISVALVEAVLDNDDPSLGPDLPRPGTAIASFRVNLAFLLDR